MILGIGIDLCSCHRFLKYTAPNDFLQKIFTPEELEYCFSRGPRAHESLAARWAAKESLCKVIGAGILSFPLTHAGVSLHDSRPTWRFTGECERKIDALGVTGAFLSLSHEREMAVAITVLEC